MSATIETPCVKVCVVKDEICIGCKRTLGEIARWLRLTPEERRAIMIEAATRPAPAAD
jgi:predicted Fe-S protein YdhL (DUF1289 family)